MSNAMKYIKDLEAAGFARTQAEAQVQMVLDALEGDLVTKSEFAIFQERIENRFTQFQTSIDRRFDQARNDMVQSEFRTVTRLAIINVSTMSVAVALLAWIIKV